MFAGAFSSALATLIGLLLVFAGALVYITLIRQIRARRAAATSEPGVTSPKVFGLAELFVAITVVLFFLYMLTAAVSRPPSRVTTPLIIANELLFIAIVLLVMAYLRLRGFTVDALAGLSKITLKRALSTGVVLLLAAWPLIAVAEVITQKLFGSSSKQEIVDFFSGSATITQRVTIIILAVVAAPIFEELIFRFFIYGVLRRYFGVTTGLVLNSLIFAAAHTHLPSALPLFVLASCFTLAYEWSGSILVSMSMHALFNASQLTFLAFPELFQQ